MLGWSVASKSFVVGQSTVLKILEQKWKIPKQKQVHQGATQMSGLMVTLLRAATGREREDMLSVTISRR